MNHELIANQAAVLMSMLTPVALKNIMGGFVEMVEDAAELCEVRSDIAIINSIIATIRTACEADD